MIIVSLFSGMLLGAVSAGLVLYSGGSIFLAILSYSFLGVVGMLLSAVALAILTPRKQDDRNADPKGKYAPV